MYEELESITRLDSELKSNPVAAKKEIKHREEKVEDLKEERTEVKPTPVANKKPEVKQVPGKKITPNRDVSKDIWGDDDQDIV
jgi:hypothetical protein